MDALLISRNQNIMIGNVSSFLSLPVSDCTAFIPHTRVIIQKTIATNIPTKFKIICGIINNIVFCSMEEKNNQKKENFS